jgi:hypothetical protein
MAKVYWYLPKPKTDRFWIAKVTAEMKGTAAKTAA